MVDDFPTVGQVFQYHFLWKWQAKMGQLEGSKARPSCVAIIVANSVDTAIPLRPMTTKQASSGANSRTIPRHSMGAIASVVIPNESIHTAA